MIDFLMHITGKLLAHGGTLKLVPAEFVEADGLSVSGWFDDDTKEITVAVGRSSWPTVLAHEYCHFLQHLDNKFTDESFQEDFNKFDLWITHKIELEPDELTRVIRQIQECELDAERRALRFVADYNLGISLDEYIQKANAYILFYEVVKHHRIWPAGPGPSSYKEIWSKLSTQLISPALLLDKNMLLPNTFEQDVLRICMKDEDPTVEIKLNLDTIETKKEIAFKGLYPCKCTNSELENGHHYLCPFATPRI